tara:strand:+ start:494905 stop:495549 length:645 start_codon:yes stop_codon:yes gene_type:complete
LGSELLSAIVGTIYFYKYKNTHLKYFLYLLWYITFTEFFSKFVASKTGFLIFYTDENGNRYTLWFYNLLNLVTFTTLAYVYFNYLKTKVFKNWIKVFAFIYVTVYAVNWVFIQDFNQENSELPRVLGSLFLIATIIFYFIELLKSEKIVLFHKMLLFWISVGLLLFYSGTIPFALKWNGYALLPGVHKLFLIVYVLAITMYLLFTFGFIWSKKE